MNANIEPTHQNNPENVNPNLPTGIVQFLNQSLTMKFIMVGVLSLLLLVPAYFVQTVIQERQSYQNKVVREISASYGNPQSISGLIIEVPKPVINEEGKTVLESVYILPETLNVKTKLDGQIKHLGIYQAVVYQSGSDLEGMINLTKAQQSQPNLLWSKARVHCLINDIKGLSDVVNVNLSQYPLILDEPSNIGGLKSLSRSVDLSQYTNNIPFKMNLNLKGSQTFWYYPLAGKMTVDLHSNWPHPSFKGSFSRNNNANPTQKGFDAQWTVHSLNSGIPTVIEGDLKHYLQQKKDVIYEDAFDSGSRAVSSTNDQENEGFGVDLIQLGDHYQLVERSSKYAILVIVLNFLAFLIFEIRSRIKVHMVQYLLSGISICLFYLLLLSFSEYIGFVGAYSVAMVVILGLIYFYTQGIFNNRKHAATITSLIGVLYLYVLVTLQLTESALITGTIGLTVILAVIMGLTKDLNKTPSNITN